MIISANTPSKLNTDNGGMILDDGLLLVGIAVSWENRDAYYIALTHEETESTCIVYFDSCDFYDYFSKHTKQVKH